MKDIGTEPVNANSAEQKSARVNDVKSKTKGDHLTPEVEKKINSYLTENLPETEERIAEEMDPSCKVSVVIPVYGEREYILRPIESLANQQDVKSDEYELILVINNPPNEPVRSENETPTDFKRKIEHYYLALKENQETLALVKFINGDDNDVEISAREKEIIEKIKNSGLKVYAIDKASPGKNLPQETANVGGARNRGVAEAIARFAEKKRNGIIAQTDADTRLDSRYIHNLIETFKKRPELIGLTGRLDYESEFGDQLIGLASLYEELERAYLTLIDDLEKQQDDFKDIKEIESFERVHFSGANMASRAFEAALVGGVPKIPGGEDPQFGGLLSEIGVIDRVPSVIVMTADRFSPRTDINAGGGQKKIKFAESLIDLGTIKVPENLENLMVVRRIKRDLGKAIKMGNTSPETLARIFSYQGKTLLSEDEFKALSQEMAGGRSIGKIVQNKKAVVLGNKAFKKITENDNKIPIEEASEKILETLKKDPKFIVKYKTIKEEMVKYENSWIEKRRQKMGNLLKTVYSGIEKGKLGDKNALWRFIVSSKDEIGLNQQDMETLERYPTIFNAMAEIIERANSEEEAMASIERLFRRDFVFLENNPQHLRLIEMKAAHESFRQVYGTEY